MLSPRLRCKMNTEIFLKSLRSAYELLAIIYHKNGSSVPVDLMLLLLAQDRCYAREIRFNGKLLCEKSDDIMIWRAQAWCSVGIDSMSTKRMVQSNRDVKLFSPQYLHKVKSRVISMF
jgi:hypothetical protein